MLDVGDDHNLNLRRWEELPCRTMLTCSWQMFVRNTGADRFCAGTRRRFERVALRAPAILQMGDQLAAVYAKDVSRTGVGFLSPFNILPRQAVELQLMDGKRLRLRITRCRRLGPSCYECGTLFELSAPKSSSPSPRNVVRES